jgi:CheY-like chemotaxis protein
MLIKDYVSTGEAAEILSISRSTVSRRFDAGLFRGKLNPITGERLISRDSIFEFIQENDLPIESADLRRRRVLVVSPCRDKATTTLKSVFKTDARVEIVALEHGADALILCSQNPPALLVVDAKLADIDAKNLIHALRRREELRHTRILLAVAGPADEPGVAQMGADACMTWAELGETGAEESVYRLIGLTQREEPPSQDGAHHRRWSRYPVNVPGRIGIYRLNAPREHSWGRAIVRNISRGGAYLSKIELDSKSIPAEPFRMLLEIDAEPLGEVRAHCQVVRMQCNGSLSAGVQFVRISRTGLEKIVALGRS